jgi:AcrR family transcriptional regulator
MADTKKNILNTSRAMFNKLGYGQVTIRMIALELNMSSGNLNYHFRKREDILEALYFEMVAEFDARIEGLESRSISLKEVKEDMQSSMERMVDYKFFWTDLYNLLMLNVRIRTHFENALMERIKGYSMLFKMLQGDGCLKAPTFAKEYQFLAERMINDSNTWLYASTLYEKNKISQSYIERMSIQLLSTLYPYLTDSGIQEFKRLFPAHFE